jgi:RNA polymerase sigma-70 factor (ECF subfamily)
VSPIAPPSFDAVVQEYGPALSRLAWGYVDHPDDHADLLQTILVALWQSLPRFRGESSVWTWTFRVAHNRARSYAARERRRATVALPEALLDPGPLPDAIADARLRQQRLFAAVRRLPDSLRQAVMLHLEGASAEEIADVQGTTAGNVAVRLTRARRALRKLMEEA